MYCPVCGARLKEVDLVPRAEFYIVAYVQPDGVVDQISHVGQASSDLKAQCQECGADVTDTLDIRVDKL
jgi:hypothetical protein